MLLIGDAVAFVDPFTGQGVYLALAEARFAANAIGDSLHDPRRERDAWREFAYALRGAVGERDLIALMMRAFVHFGPVARRARTQPEAPTCRFRVLDRRGLRKTPEQSARTRRRTGPRAAMISTVNTIAIEAPARLIYELASATELWSNLLPHYRFVHILSGNSIERTVEMGARRGIVPVRWVAVQRNDVLTPSIRFRHIRGWTAGMEAVWQFQERNGETTVSISHALDFAFPVASRVIEKYVVADYFIDDIATRTLTTFKRLAEEIARG